MISWGEHIFTFATLHRPQTYLHFCTSTRLHPLHPNTPARDFFDLSERDGGGTAGADSRKERGECFGVSFASSRTSKPGGMRGGSRKVRRAERLPVIDFGGPTFARDRDALLGQMSGLASTVVDNGEIAVGEAQFEAAAILAVNIAG